MKTPLKVCVRVLCLAMVWLGSSGTGAAAMLTGQIGMMGKTVLDAPLGTATSFVSFSNARIGYGMGDYDVPGLIPVNTPVTFTPMMFTATPASPLVLWEFTVAGHLYALELQSLTYDRFTFGANSFLNLSGRGVATLDGGRHTPAEFCLSTQQCTDSTGTTVTWSSETILSSVPEGGKAWVCLFLGLLGIEIFRRTLHTGTTHPLPER